MVSVDKVYQRILAILNKENRGYMTPQEYNLLANQVQLEIFEQYFFDLGQYNRRGEINNEYANIVKNIKEKIDLFKVEDQSIVYDEDSGKFPLPENLYRLGTVQYDDIEVEPLTTNEFIYINKSPLTKPSKSYPVYIRDGENIKIYPYITNDDNDPYPAVTKCSFVKKPKEVNWTYTEVGGVALYNATADDHQNFELHASEETTLVTKILVYAGITIKQPDIVQVADAQDTKKITQEKS